MTTFHTAAAALAMLIASASLAAAESSSSDNYIVCKPGYELNALKTACVKK